MPRKSKSAAEDRPQVEFDTRTKVGLRGDIRFGNGPALFSVICSSGDNAPYTRITWNFYRHGVISLSSLDLHNFTYLHREDGPWIHLNEFTVKVRRWRFERNKQQILGMNSMQSSWFSDVGGRQYGLLMQATQLWLEPPDPGHPVYDCNPRTDLHRQFAGLKDLYWRRRYGQEVAD